MLVQNSFKNDNKTLYIIPTPIGNLDDITIRTLNTLKEVSVLLCEDTRKTGILLKHYEINLKMVSYHEHNKDNFEQKFINIIENNDKVGLVSDAGMPGISDPGFELIKWCSQNDVNVVVLPGPSAFVLGAVRSTFDNSEFSFHSFLKGSKNEKRNKLVELIESGRTSIFYESTHKIISTLKTIDEINPTVEVCIGRELTKINEQYIIGTANEIINHLEANVNKGEYIVIINRTEKTNVELSVEKEYEKLLSEGVNKKEAIKQIAKNRNVSKNEIYMKFTGE